MGIFDRFKSKRTAELPPSKSTPKVSSESAGASRATTPSPKSAEKRGAPESKTVQKTGVHRGILLRPFLTEKSYRLSETNQVVFQVAAKANKIQVASAFKELYGVTPVSVRIIVQKGKHVAFRRIRGVRQDVKKAMITLPAGQTIDVFEHAK